MSTLINQDLKKIFENIKLELNDFVKQYSEVIEFTMTESTFIAKCIKEKVCVIKFEGYLIQNKSSETKIKTRLKSGNFGENEEKTTENLEDLKDTFEKFKSAVLCCFNE